MICSIATVSTAKEPTSAIGLWPVSCPERAGGQGPDAGLALRLLLANGSAMMNRTDRDGGAVERVRTDVLEICYETGGPPDGMPVFLVHGWPDAPRGWNQVAAHPEAAGWRTIRP